MVLLPEAEAKSTLSGAPARHADRNPSLQFIRHRTHHQFNGGQNRRPPTRGYNGRAQTGLSWETAVNIYYRGQAEPGAHANTRVGVRRQLLEFSYQLAPCGSWEWSWGHQAWLQAPLPAEPYHQPLSEILWTLQNHPQYIPRPLKSKYSLTKVFQASKSPPKAICKDAGHNI